MNEMALELVTFFRDDFLSGGACCHFLALHSASSALLRVASGAAKQRQFLLDRRKACL